MTSETPSTWDKYRRVGQMRFLKFVQGDADKCAEVEAAIYQYSVGKDGAMQGSNTYKELVRIIQGRSKDGSGEPVGPSPHLAEARDRYLQGGLTVVQLVQVITSNEGALSSMLAGGYGGAPAPFNPDVERKVTPEIPASPEVPPVPAIVIPPPEGPEVLEQFNDLKALLGLVERMRPETVLGLKRKAEARRALIEPIWQKEKKMKEDALRLEERKQALQHCSQELAEKSAELDAFDARAAELLAEDRAQRLAEMEALKARIKETQRLCMAAWAERDALEEEGKELQRLLDAKRSEAGGGAGAEAAAA